jgi:2-C-methyl-D-erythritol 4-phosphate cytidylyltransferase
VRTVALVLAAGRGERLGHSLPKGFVPLAGRPLLLHALETLEAVAEVERVVPVIPSGALPRYREALAGAPGLRKLTEPVAGGKERQDSVRAGLAALPPGMELVAVHDAARPLVRPAAVRRVIEVARAAGAAILAAPVRDTVKRVVDGRVVATPPRGECWAAQTPQVFRVEILLEALAKADAEGLVGTDDAQLVEALGVEVRVVAGDPDNLKVTGPEELALAEELLRLRRAGAEGSRPRGARREAGPGARNPGAGR